MRSFLRVNPIACDGAGLCAELFPERIGLDDWGFPIVDPAPIPRELEADARGAVAACPTMALLLGRLEAAPPEQRG
jgi:ferredoxin